MGLLGRGYYDVAVQRRGGTPLVDVLPAGDLSFSRRLDDSSTASARVASHSTPSLGSLDAWEHELSVRRDGPEVWVGPVVTVDWEPDFVSLTANDLFFWMERRLLDQQDRAFTDVDAGTIFSYVLADALKRDPSPNIVAAVSATGILASRSYKAEERRRAADVLRELARTAVDFTAVGREIRCGGQEIPSTRSFTLVDDTLLSPKLTSIGTDAATEVSVVGANLSGQAIGGVSGGSTERFGLVQQAYNEATIEDSSSALVAAATRWRFLSSPPLSLSGVLAPDAPVDFADLVPGSRVRVQLLNLDRQVDADFRLTQVDVHVQFSEQGSQEEVAVTLEPLGTVLDG